MSLESTIERLIKTIARKALLMQITEGVVTAVDKNANTCDVERDDLPALFKVRLNSILDAGSAVITVYPSVGSKVLCAIIENNPTDAYVIGTNGIDEIIINGGENGGLTKTPLLVQELKKTNELLNSILGVLNGTVITEPGNGYASALQAALKAALAGKELGNFDEIENEKIKH